MKNYYQQKKGGWTMEPVIYAKTVKLIECYRFFQQIAACSPPVPGPSDLSSSHTPNSSSIGRSSDAVLAARYLQLMDRALERYVPAEYRPAVFSHLVDGARYADLEGLYYFSVSTMKRYVQVFVWGVARELGETFQQHLFPEYLDNSGACQFRTKATCQFRTAGACQIRTAGACQVRTAGDCQVRTEGDRQFRTEGDCQFHTASDCQFQTESNLLRERSITDDAAPCSPSVPRLIPQLSELGRKRRYSAETLANLACLSPVLQTNVVQAIIIEGVKMTDALSRQLRAAASTQTLTIDDILQICRASAAPRRSRKSSAAPRRTSQPAEPKKYAVPTELFPSELPSDQRQEYVTAALRCIRDQHIELTLPEEPSAG